MKEIDKKTVLKNRFSQLFYNRIWIIYLSIYAISLLIFLGSFFQLYGKPTNSKFTISAPPFYETKTASLQESVGGCSEGLTSCLYDGKKRCISITECEQQAKNSLQNRIESAKQQLTLTPSEPNSISDINYLKLLEKRNEPYRFCIANAEEIYKNGKEEYKKRMKELAEVAKKNAEILASPLPSPSCTSQRYATFTAENANEWFQQQEKDFKEQDIRCSPSYSEYIDESILLNQRASYELLEQISEYYKTILTEIQNDYSNNLASCENLFNCENPTAQCNDGTFSCSTNRSGTCSHHNGVFLWL